MIKPLLFIAISLASLFIGFFSLDPKTCTSLISDYGYWFILSVSAIFTFFLFIQLKSHFTKHPLSPSLLKNRKFLIAIFTIVAASLFSRVHEPTEFKIIMDEPALTAVGTTMHLKREAMVPIRAHHIMGNYTILAGYVDKRPLLFPFLVSTVHDLTGYRPTNAFLLNLALTPLFFTLLYLFIYQLAGYSAASLGILLSLCLPLLHRTANGAGFELLNLVLILSTMLCALAYLRRPNNIHLSTLCLSTVLLSQVRYESILYVFPVAIIILLGWFYKRKLITPWAFFLTPTLFIPYLWQHHTFILEKGFWQLEDISSATTPFSFSYFYDNLGHAFNFFFSFTRAFPNTFLLPAFGSIAIGLFLLFLYQSFKSKAPLNKPTTVFAIFLLGFAAYSLLMLTYFYGQFDHPIIHRLSLPMHLPMIIAIAWFFNFQNNLWLKKACFLITSATLFLFTIPTISSHQYSKTYLPTKEAAWIMEFSKNNKQPMFIISDRPALWVINQVDTLPAGFANIRKDAIKYYLDQPNAPDIFINQVCVFNPETKQFDSTLDIDKDFVSIPHKEYLLSELYKMELRKVVDVLNTSDPSPSDVELQFPSIVSKYMNTWAKNLP